MEVAVIQEEVVKVIQVLLVHQVLQQCLLSLLDLFH
jgi:hypothetical protein